MTMGLHVEQAAIRMKIDATKWMNIAAAGTTSQALIRNIEASMLSKIPDDDTRYSVLSSNLDREEPDETSVPGAIIDEGGISESSATAPKRPSSQEPMDEAKLQKLTEPSDDSMPDICSITEAKRLVPSTTIPTSKTGVPDKWVSDRIPIGRQSWYRCVFEGGCLVDFASSKFDRVTTHLRRKHLGVCIGCKACNHVGFWSESGFVRHMDTKHPDIKKEDRRQAPPASLGAPLVIKEEVTDIDD